MNNLVFKVATASLVVAVVIIGWVIWDNDYYRGPVSLKVDEHCNLHMVPCRAQSANGEWIELSIRPLAIPLLTPLDLTVRLHGIKVDSVNVVFTGIDVDMGRLEYPLNSTDGVVYMGGASLSICSRLKMRWQALVLIKSNNRRIAVPFEFETEYRSNFKLI